MPTYKTDWEPKKKKNQKIDYILHVTLIAGNRPSVFNGLIVYIGMNRNSQNLFLKYFFR